MNSVFKLRKNGLCGVSIVGLELDGGEYAQLTGKERHYRYDESITINAVYKVDSDGNELLYKTFIVEHNNSDICDFEFDSDGLYLITHRIIPTQDHFFNAYDEAKYSYAYYYDSEELLFRDYIGGQLVEIEDILLINPDAIYDGKPTTVIGSSQETFCICKLYECFYSLCRNSLTKFCSKCITKLDHQSQDIINRDLVWMTINVISYLMELGDFAEALRIYESIQVCGGTICKELQTKKSGSCGCY